MIFFMVDPCRDGRSRHGFLGLPLRHGGAPHRGHGRFPGDKGTNIRPKRDTLRDTPIKSAKHRARSANGLPRKWGVPRRNGKIPRRNTEIPRQNFPIPRQKLMRCATAWRELPQKTYRTPIKSDSECALRAKKFSQILKNANFFVPLPRYADRILRVFDKVLARLFGSLLHFA